jgi:hypothetical protein
MSRGLNVCRNAVLRGPNKWLTRSMCECSRNSPVDWVWTLATERALPVSFLRFVLLLFP